ncbi:MAG: hypothetical protein JWO36_3792 [Myxococcales bacterium]|nr:hypothetical protein [Myxococcales bacterium]
MSLRLLVAVLVVMTVGCTRWATSPSYGPRNEVARRLVGSPQVEEVTSSNVSAGFGGVSSQNGFGTTVASGGLSGSHDSVKRTHCVQAAQIDYMQPVDLVPHIEHRALDVAGSITVGLLGLIVVTGASNRYNNDLDFYNRDPSFFPMPSQPTGAYVAGGVMIAGGLGWLAYSLLGLPKEAPPPVQTQQRQWTETQYVEASGCGLVPSDRP